MAKKIQVHSDGFVKDVRAGLTDDDLRRKYRLSAKQYQNLLEQLLDSGKLEQSDLEDHRTVYEATVELASTCPECGALKLVDSETCPHCDAKTAVSRIPGEEDQTVRLPLEALLKGELGETEMSDQGTSFEWGVTSDLEPEDGKDGIPENQLADQWKDDWQDAWEKTAIDKEPFVEGAAPELPPRPRKRRNRILLAVGQLALAVIVLTAIGFYTELIPLPAALKSDARTVRKTDRPKMAGVAAKREKPQTKPKSRKHRSPSRTSGNRDIQAPKPKAPKKVRSPVREVKREPRGHKVARPEKAVKPAKESAPKPAKRALETGSQKTKPSKPARPEKVVQRQEQASLKEEKRPLKKKRSPPPVRSAAQAVKVVQPKKAAATQRARPVGLKDTTDLRTVEKPKPGAQPRLVSVQKPRPRIASVHKEDRLPAASGYDGTVLIYGVKKGDSILVQLLLERGGNADAKDVNGDTALIIASRDGRDAIVNLLLKSGADPTLKNAKGFTAIMEACEAGKTKVLKSLLAHDKEKGRAELFQASTTGRTNVVISLVRNGADVDAKDGEGNTCLMLAASKGNLKMVRLVLALGADVQATDRLGHSALTWASFPPPGAGYVPLKDRRQIVRVLKAHARNKRGPISAR